MPGGVGFAIDDLGEGPGGEADSGSKLAGGGRFAGPAEWLGPELDAGALFELGDELVGSEGRIGASGLAEGGGFAASEGGEALPPVSRRWPMALELSGIEPGGRRREVEVRAGRGPAVVGGGGTQTGPDWVHFDVAEGGGPMVVVEHAGKETTLPEMAAKFLDGVAVGGVLAVDVHHEEGDRIRAIASDNEVKVI